MTILSTNEDYELCFVPALNATFLKFFRKPSVEQFRKAYFEMSEAFIADKSISSHITDTSLMGVVPLESQQFVIKEIVPAMRRSLPSNQELVIALILGDDVFASFAAKNMGKKVSEKLTGVNVNFFGNYEAGVDWLKAA